MLNHLSIRNIVLISAADIPFENGLCVLTGETGAGKSILLDALGLALGMRADSGLVRFGEEQASVTATFDIEESSATRSVMQELGLEPDDTLIIRRNLTADGKSRCFVNDQPVSVTALKRLGETLVEIHGQHDQRGLLDMSTHLEMVDEYGQLDTRTLDDSFHRWQKHKSELQHVRLRIEEAVREQDYIRHVREELSSLNIQPGEEAELTELRTTMMQGEKLAGVVQDALGGLQGNPGVEDVLRDVQRGLMRSSVASVSRYQPVIESLERAQVEVQEAVSALEAIAADELYDPVRLEAIEERLFALKAASRKYNVPVDELPELFAEVDGKLQSLDAQQEQIETLESLVDEARDAYLMHAQKLSDQRAKVAQQLQKSLMKELEPLKMGRCRFRVVQEELREEYWSARGTDAIRFEAATNAGQHYAALHKIASGGELSRFMLAMKVVLSRVKSTPTLIFDEVDTGTGGAVADAIGARLAILSDRAQVLVVTHLPQVAARGTHHLFIDKRERKNVTHTTVAVLDVQDRKEELARMLAGATVTDEARGAAGRLMEAAG